MNLQKKWDKVAFENFVFNISERVEPNDTSLDKYIGLEHIDSGKIKIERIGNPSAVIGTKLKIYQGDIIFGKRRAYQRKAALVEFDAICSAHSMVLRVNEKNVLKEYLLVFIHSDLFMNRAIEISEGSLSPTIKWKTLAKQQFPLPPLEEQKQIADLFQSIETAIEQVEGQEKNLKLLRQKLIDSLCEKGESISKAFKMSEWQKCKIEDIAYWYQRDISNDKQAENGIEVYICADHIESSEILISRNGKLDDGKKGPTITKHFREGDFLFSTRSVSLHKAAVAQVSGVTGEKLIVIDVLASSKIIKGFLPYIMHSSKFWSFAKVTASGSVNKFSSWNKIKQYEFFLPPHNEQQKFTELFQQLEDLLKQLKQQETTLKNLKQKLLNEILR